MEERKLNEKESLELITRMIRNTKHNLEIGDGNIFLFWGYLTVTSTAIVYLLLQLTETLMSYLAFLLIIVVGIPLSYYFKRKRLPKVKTYTDKVLEQIWGVMGSIATLTTTIFGIYYDGRLIPPLILIILSLACYITGLLIKEKVFNLGIVSFINGLNMLFYIIKEGFDSFMLLLFALSFIVMMIIPGHVLNYKAKKSCSKN